MNPIALHAYNPGPFTGAGNTTWLLPGRVSVLIDAGVGDARHVGELRAALGSTRLNRVLVTHGHSDHAAGAAALGSELRDVRFAKMPWPERDARYPVTWEPLADGDVVEAGDDRLVAVHTPGHAPDHLCFWHQATGSVFCGDLAVAGTTVVIPARNGGDLGAYLASLERVLALEPVRLLPAHGPVIDEPQRVLRRYLEHRREREAQILAALAGGEATPAAIVRTVYAGLPPPLVHMAEESVLAHLLKLEREGRVRHGADGWTMI